MPENVKLMTVTNNYKEVSDGKLLLRLAHLYSVGEHPTLSEPATVNLGEVFAKSGFKISNVEETSLTGNQPPVSQTKWDTYAPNDGVARQIAEHKAFPDRVPFDTSDPKLSVVIRPMELRTFFVEFS